MENKQTKKTQSQIPIQKPPAPPLCTLEFLPLSSLPWSKRGRKRNKEDKRNKTEEAEERRGGNGLWRRKVMPPPKRNRANGNSTQSTQHTWKTNNQKGTQQAPRAQTQRAERASRQQTTPRQQDSERRQLVATCESRQQAKKARSRDEMAGRRPQKSRTRRSQQRKGRQIQAEGTGERGQVQHACNRSPGPPQGSTSQSQTGPSKFGPPSLTPANDAQSLKAHSKLARNTKQPTKVSNPKESCVCVYRVLIQDATKKKFAQLRVLRPWGLELFIKVNRFPKVHVLDERGAQGPETKKEGEPSLPTRGAPFTWSVRASDGACASCGAYASSSTCHASC